ncbi:MAG: hypothetical protein C0606_03870 [Hyphomicrobiales bacterium]|nr:MAG: hypothetical protein C0606_03870 [Hyphomicrobiales bacterium]
MHYSKMAKKEMKRFGFETHMSIDETESIRRGFELWLVTLASGFDLTFRDRALFVWDTLHASATSFDELLQYRRSTKELNSELGNDTDLKILDLPTALMWEQIAYVPSFIAPLLRKPIIAPTQTP